MSSHEIASARKIPNKDPDMTIKISVNAIFLSNFARKYKTINLWNHEVMNLAFLQKMFLKKDSLSLLIGIQETPQDVSSIIE